MKYFFALTAFLCFELSAQVIEPPKPGNLLTATVTATVTQDPNDQLYTYSYEVANHSTSEQRLTSFTIDLSEDAQIVSVESPKGWDHGVTPDNTLLMWDAVDIDPEDEPENWDGNLLPSSYDIKPGRSLSGFLVKTYTPPKQGKFYATGFVRLAVVTDVADLEEGGYETPLFPNDSYIGVTEVPLSSLYDGNRRPAVDGFLAFVNLNGKNNKFIERATIYLKTSVNGEQIDRESLNVKLNGVDVTSVFIVDTTKVGDLVGHFELDGSALMQGKNILLTSIEGVVPGTSRTAVDTDRITFTVEKSPVTKAHINFDFDSGDGNNGKGKGSVK